MPGIDWRGVVKVWHLISPTTVTKSICGVEIASEHGATSHVASVTCRECYRRFFSPKPASKEAEKCRQS